MADSDFTHADGDGGSHAPIPKVFHRIWLGGPMPEEFRRYGTTWTDRHPDWTMVEWTEDNLPPLRNQECFDAAISLAEQSDILRFEILWLHGGVYLDTDFECLRPIDELLEGVSAFSAHEFDDADRVATGVMGAVAQHPFIGAVIDALPASIAEHGSSNPPSSTGPAFMTRCVAAWAASGHEELTVFPASMFYPYSWRELHRRFEDFPDAYAVHHWAGSWREPAGSRLQRWARRILMRTAPTRRILYLHARITKGGAPPQAMIDP